MSARFPTSILLDDIQINRSVGANYFFPDTVKDIDGSLRKLKVGTNVTGVKVIAGKGVSRQIDRIDHVRSLVPGSKASDWQKLRGTGTVDLGGVDVKAELHWYSMVGDKTAYDLKVKRYLF